MGQCESGTWMVAARGVTAPSFYPPANITGSEERNSSLLQNEYGNLIKWEPNPMNTGINITKYRIYRKQYGNWIFLADMDATDTQYWHRGIDQYIQHEYAITALSDLSQESCAGYITVY